MKRDLGRLLATCATTAAFLVTSSGCGSTDSSGSDQAAHPVDADAAPPAAPMSEQITVSEVAVYQATKAVLVSDGAPVDAPNAPIIAARPGVVRVFVKALGATRPQVGAKLVVKRAGKPDLELHDSKKRVALRLDDSNLSTTFNFEIGADDMTPDATFSFTAGADLGGTDVVTYPADGSDAPFGAKTGSQTLKVKLVPVAYQTDGSGRTPDLSDTNYYKDALYRMYPTAKVEISVRDPFKWSEDVMPDGTGWDGLLGGIMQVRKVDKAPADVYYVGVFNPMNDLSAFCSSGGCVLGIAPQASADDVGMRVALVLGYRSRQAGGTLAQELAHAMGRAHAPCGDPAAIDKKFPYKDGSIGVWGYDVVAKQYKGPDSSDFMSYCGNVWTSDYTFKGIYQRMELVTSQVGGTPTTTTGANIAQNEAATIFVARDGTVTAGPTIPVSEVHAPDSDESMSVAFEEAGGRVLGTTRAAVRSISNTGGRLLVLPQAPSGAVRARVAGLGVADLRSAAMRFAR
ncbi:hypothetical protein AKJ09_05555 [Labilithrix luteola]|uniref:Uncharacterized protein n=1 Tax=Labilithrix luteola TaxID=1391654 RepID=A0A0K1PZT2_9BACT|nr:M66 family metalloprotease [Labilithrix luteola]AKU98891.1 hypothetical protein AKJ09_05555 [Labilithrix luteola]